MTQFLFIRHGETDAVGHRLVGRQPGIHLTERGRRQVRALARRLESYRLDRLVCSPLERTRESAEAIAAERAVTVEIDEDLLEVEFGSWTGKTFEEMQQDPTWADYHRFRGGVRIPGGEMGLEVQARMVAATERLRRETPDGVVALVGHGDPIRYAVAHYGGVPLDLALRIDIDVASVTVIAVDNRGARLRCVNSGAELPIY